eukprot:TRINITY_DN5223_c0_g1_i1.p1 TRINITY_DN5223_c0_g1~~TRINITY_DN5223_c0_g1_i1.p1  ORF type:complete len:309 (-),score=65.18 TRINITY_DN5223_c0_g1_i1:448-1374(-)
MSHPQAGEAAPAPLSDASLPPQHAAARIISGTSVANEIKSELSSRIALLKTKHEVVPALAVLLVGARADSLSYVAMKKKVAAKLGVRMMVYTFEQCVEESSLVDRIDACNADADIHGILVQLPLPEHICEENVIRRVAIEKDVDAFHFEHLGRLARRDTEFHPLFLPCTASGCMELLRRSAVDVRGKHAVIVGRSKLVGMPVSLLLLKQDATVTVCHSKTQNIADIVGLADILIVAIGQPQFVRGHWIKPGATVLDVGANAVRDNSARGYHLVGDVCFEEALTRAGMITPVPGGVGPMTYDYLYPCSQ